MIEEDKKDAMQDYSSEDYKKYQEGLAYMRRENITTRSRVNERMYAGDQWFHVGLSNKLPRIVVNFIKRTVNFLVAAIMGGEYKISYSAFPSIDEEEDEENIAVAEAFTDYAEVAMEEMDMIQNDEEMIKDGILAGIGLQHFYFDPTIYDTNGGRIQGKMKCEIIDAVNYFPDDPTNKKLQEQKANRITYRDSVENIKEEAKSEGMPDHVIELIKADSQYSYDSFDKADQEKTGLQNATVIITYKRESNGNIWQRKCVKGVQFTKYKDTEKCNYPLVDFVGEERKKCIYGTSPVSEIVPNQIYVNTIFAMAMVSTQKTAYPTTYYDTERVSGISNGVGMAVPVNGDVSGAVYTPPTGTVGSDVYNITDVVISQSKENIGANDTLLGNLKPENTSALLVNQEQSEVPLETIRRRFMKAKENQGRILEEFWKVHYISERPAIVKDESGQERRLMFRGDDFKDVMLKTRVDVGLTSKYDEIISYNMLNGWFENGHIDFIELLENLPRKIMPKARKLLEKRKTEGMSELPEENEVIQVDPVDMLTNEEVVI